MAQIQGSAAIDASYESVITTPQQSQRDANNPAGLLSIAEETLAEFLSKPQELLSIGSRCLG
ncbi:putative class III homeodomain-leucine zipper family [Helianthus annuus]|nr:putative class III homeodomain-leucine zipper family [Helianthus annuus]